ncbi:MAG: pyruvate kinase [Patescibacteria group bacterium]
MIKIIATIGPASKDVKTLKEMIKAGMNIARLNFSHGTYEAHANLIKNIREAEKQSGARLPIMQDLSGPRIQGRTDAKTGSTAHSFKKGIKTFTPKDRTDLLFGIKQKVDYIVLSYIKDKNDILRLKEFLDDNNYKIPIVAKIETKQAIKNIKSIIKIADLIMIGRGDLATAIPMEKIPFAQKMIIELSNKAKKPVITATEMLKSMVASKTPTRAEITDIANAILDGTNMIMLSEETAMGKYPIETITIMRKIAKEAEMYAVHYDI